jgi:hypothetical protein
MRGGSVSATPALPAAAGSDWWTAVQAHLQAEAYAVRPAASRAPGTFEADNPSLRMQARFSRDGLTIVPTPTAQDPHDPRSHRKALAGDAVGAAEAIAAIGGVETAASDGEGWTAGLRLAAYGAGDLVRPVAAAPTATGARVEFQYHEAGGSSPALTEWYLNGARGIEHGFTLAVPPSGPGPVTLALAVSGDLRPELEAGGNAVVLRTGTGAVVLRYADLYVTDAAGRTLPARLTVPPGDPSAIHLVVDTTDAVYPVTVDPLLTTPATILNGEASGNYFGY